MACAPKYTVASWEIIQQARIEAGVEPLQWDASLLTIADERARYMAENTMLEHDPDLWQHKGDHEWACEVIGRQPFVDPGQNQVVLDAIGQGWINSTEHRDCVVGEGFKRAAIAGYVGKDGWVYEVMWLTD